MEKGENRLLKSVQTFIYRSSGKQKVRQQHRKPKMKENISFDPSAVQKLPNWYFTPQHAFKLLMRQRRCVRGGLKPSSDPCPPRRTPALWWPGGRGSHVVPVKFSTTEMFLHFCGNGGLGVGEGLHACRPMNVVEMGDWFFLPSPCAWRHLSRVIYFLRPRDKSGRKFPVVPGTNCWWGFRLESPNTNKNILFLHRSLRNRTPTLGVWGEKPKARSWSLANSTHSVFRLDRPWKAPSAMKLMRLFPMCSSSSRLRPAKLDSSSLQRRLEDRSLQDQNRKASS